MTNQKYVPGQSCAPSLSCCRYDITLRLCGWMFFSGTGSPG